MKTLIIKYKEVLQFLGLFFGSYLVLTLVYTFYLDLSVGGIYPPDYITHLVSKQSSSLISNFGYSVEVIPHPTETSMKLFINNQFLARIVEGCNAISILILFAAFIIAFAQKLKTTLLYIFAGVAIIYAINILRIAILAIALYEFPEHQEFLHQIVFPAIIYGIVFLLWIVWVKMLPNRNKENE